MAESVQLTSLTTNRFGHQEKNAGGSTPNLQKPKYNPQGPTAVQVSRSQLQEEGKKADDLIRSEIFDINLPETSSEEQKEEKKKGLFNTKSFQILSLPNIVFGICLLTFAIAGVYWFLNSFSSTSTRNRADQTAYEIARARLSDL